MRHVGETTARLVARTYGTIEAFSDAMVAAQDKTGEAYLDLNNIDGIGAVVADAMVEFFAEDHNSKVLAALLAEVNPQPIEAVASSSAGCGQDCGVYRLARTDDPI